MSSSSASSSIEFYQHNIVSTGQGNRLFYYTHYQHLSAQSRSEVTEMGKKVLLCFDAFPGTKN